MTGGRRAYIGLSCTGHENALAIVDDQGSVLHAEATERPTQLKRAVNIPPDDAVRIRDLVREHCGDCDELVAARTWSSAAERAVAADAASMREALRGRRSAEDGAWMRRVLFQAGLWDTMIGPNRELAGTGLATYCANEDVRLIRRSYPHHLCHAAYACLVSPFEEAVAAVFDGYGEGGTYDYFTFREGRLEPLPRVPSTRNRFGSLSSLGLFYGMTICELFGFQMVSGDEWKVMGLAPYGRHDPELATILAEHISVDGLDLVMDARGPYAFRRLQAYGKAPEQSFEEVADVAYTAQEHFSQLLLEVFDNLHALTGVSDLVFSGGCALNSSLNGRASTEGPFTRIFVPPAPSDDGNAVGAALLAHRQDHPDHPWAPVAHHSPYLGTDVDEAELAAFLANGPALGLVPVDADGVPALVASALADGQIVGWMQGRAEFGPRALGNRSILADARRPDIKDRINGVVKFREGFRPFAPAILHEHGDAYFEDYRFTPYMERTMRFRAERRGALPGVSHVDGTGRAQSVTAGTNPRFHRLLAAFHEQTGVPVLLNTSLNVMGKPIVHSVADAVTLYLTSGIDLLVVGDHVFRKPTTTVDQA